MDINKCLLDIKSAVVDAGKIAINLRSNIKNIGKSLDHCYLNNSELQKNKSALSIADFECQKIIMKSLLQSYSFCGVYAEESNIEIAKIASNFAYSGELRPEKYTFLIDPIDGTRNYLSINSENSDKYGIFISLAYGFEIIAGAVYYPEHNILIHAIKNQGVFINNKRCRSLGNMQLFSPNDPISVGASVKHNLAFLRAKKSYNCGCYNVKSILQNEVHAYYTTEIPLLDFGFLSLAVEEAGGFFGNEKSEPINLSELLVKKGKELFISGFVLVANSRQYHRQVTELLRKNL